MVGLLVVEGLYQAAATVALAGAARLEYNCIEALVLD